MDTMRPQLRLASRARGALLFVPALGIAGCGNAAANAGNTGDAGQSQGGAQATGGAGGQATGGQAEACPVVPPAPPASATGRIDIPVRVTSFETPMSIGVTASGQAGREYKLSLLKFFFSQPELVDAQGQAFAAQFLGADGKPLPYGLALVDADDQASQALHLAAIPGTYTALRFGVGVPAVCNHVSSTSQVFPLNPDSDMFWTWGSQFLFIRIEGNAKRTGSEAWEPFFYHLGYDAAFTSKTIPGALTVGASTASSNAPALLFDVDQLLKTDAPSLPPGDHSAPDAFVLGNLQQPQTLRFE
jgi:hypothetical protein